MTTASLSTLRDLKLGGMADAYEAVLATPLDQQPSSTPNAKTGNAAAWNSTSA
jgi:hypothetical protein